VDWRKLPEPEDRDDDAPADPDVIDILGFDPDDPKEGLCQPDTAHLDAEGFRVYDKQSKKTESEKRMPNNTSEKLHKLLFIKGYMTAKGADRKTESQLVDLAMKEYPGWKEKTIRHTISWLKATTRQGGLKADGLKCTLLKESGTVGERKSDEAAKPAKRKRSSYMSARDLPLSKRRIKIWGYDKNEKFVCRLEINAAGVEVFAGERGGTSLRNLNWEGLVEVLSKP
jgi:hypothetical protein